MDNSSKNNNNLPSQGVLGIRVILGGYLMYLAQSLVKGRAESSMNPIVMWIFVVIFAVVGAILVGLAVKSFYLGEYIGGKADPSVNESEDIEVVDEAEPAESVEAEESVEVQNETAEDTAEAIEESN